MSATLEREIARQRVEPPVQTPAPPVRRGTWIPWMVGAILVIGLGAFLWANSPDDGFTWQEFAAAEDALATADVTPVPAPGLTLQEFAAAEDALATVARLTSDDFAAAESALATADVEGVPAPGLSWREFAAAEDQLDR